MKNFLTFIMLCFYFLNINNALASNIPKYSDRDFVVDMSCKEEKICILNSETKELWKSKAKNLQEKTGVQLVLLIAHGTNDITLEEYSNESAMRMRVGTKNNGGVLFVIDNKNKRSRLEVSRSLEGAISDIIAKGILTNFEKDLKGGTNDQNISNLPNALNNLFDSVGKYATEENKKGGGKAFVPEKNKTFTYFLFSCLIITLISSLVAVLWYSERSRYTKGSIIGGTLCAVAELYFYSLSIHLLSAFIVGFIITYILAFFWHKAGDGLGWDIANAVDFGSSTGNGVGMAEGVGDFAGGGASNLISSTLQSVGEGVTSGVNSCDMPDFGSCDGCDIGGCDI